MTTSIYTARYYLGRWGAYMRADLNAGLGVGSINLVYKQAVGSPSYTEVEEPSGVRIIQTIYLFAPDSVREMLDIKYKDDKPYLKACEKLGIKKSRYFQLLGNAERYVQKELSLYPVGEV